MLKEILIFAGGVALGAVGTAYCAGLEAGRDSVNSCQTHEKDEEEAEVSSYEENTENFQAI